jgi:hypothetical protein
VITVTRRDDPPDHDEALEIRVQGHLFAWDDADGVYQYGAGAAIGAIGPQREDGYSLIGTLTPLDEPEYDPAKHLAEYASQHLRRTGQSGAAHPDAPEVPAGQVAALSVPRPRP